MWYRSHSIILMPSSWSILHTMLLIHVLTRVWSIVITPITHEDMMLLPTIHTLDLWLALLRDVVPSQALKKCVWLLQCRSLVIYTHRSSFPAVWCAFPQNPHEALVSMERKSVAVGTVEVWFFLERFLVFSSSFPLNADWANADNSRLGTSRLRNARISSRSSLHAGISKYLSSTSLGILDSMIGYRSNPYLSLVTPNCPK